MAASGLASQEQRTGNSPPPPTLPALSPAHPPPQGAPHAPSAYLCTVLYLDPSSLQHVSLVGMNHRKRRCKNKRRRSSLAVSLVSCSLSCTLCFYCPMYGTYCTLVLSRVEKQTTREGRFLIVDWFYLTIVCTVVYQYICRVTWKKYLQCAVSTWNVPFPITSVLKTLLNCKNSNIVYCYQIAHIWPCCSFCFPSILSHGVKVGTSHTQRDSKDLWICWKLHFYLCTSKNVPLLVWSK
jgi:hypothetical protein